MCPQPQCKCQKQITFPPNQLRLEGVGFKSTIEKIFKSCGKACNSFPKPTINTLVPVIGIAFEAQTIPPKKIRSRLQS